MRVLLVEPYAADSHRAWAEGYAHHSAHDVDVLTHDGSFWKWRMQGAALTMAEAVADRPVPDVVLASDMLHLPAFLGLARRHLGDVPVALYFHENQFTYPLVPGAAEDLAYPLINWLSMAAADRVFFNSGYHMREALAALPGLLRRFPDARHDHLVADVSARCSVLHLGLDLRELDGPDLRDRPPSVLWNHRWEYDKAPNVFFDVLDRLVAEGLEFRVILAGRNFRNEPAEFHAARRRLGDRVIQFGWVDRERYPDTLRSADVSVSTAQHDFFGAAVVEAAYAGAIPILPNRLAYPELIPEQWHGSCLYDDVGDLTARLRKALVDPEAARRRIVGLAEAMGRFDWSVIAPQYDQCLAELAG